MSPYLTALRARVGHDLVLMPSVAACIADGQGRLLLARHLENDVWGLPGGLVEPDEDPAGAVAREVLEETGLQVVAERVLGAYGGPDFRVRYPHGDLAAYVMVAYACRVRGGTLRADQHEVAEARYVAPAELPGLHLTAWAPRVLPELYARMAAAAARPADAEGLA